MMQVHAAKPVKDASPRILSPTTEGQSVLPALVTEPMRSTHPLSLSGRKQTITGPQ